jgi:hypothetical protein
VYNLPAQLIKLRSICNVPLSEFSEVQTPKDFSEEKDRLGFLKLLRKRAVVSEPVQRVPKHIIVNAAAWLGFPAAPDSPVSLWVTFKDSKGESSVLVDEQRIESPGSVMLSGNVSLEFTGPVEYIKVSCGGLKDEDRFSVDELYVKNQRDLGDVQQAAG